MYGIIDIGSNTIRLSCYKQENGELVHVVHKKTTAGLAGYITKEGKMSDKGIEKAISVLKELNEVINNMKIDELYVIATASLRNICNTEDIVNRIYKETGLTVDVISGKEEAVCDFIGATYGRDIEEGMVLDIGGGSTEVAFFKEEMVDDAASVPIGSLNMYTKHVADLLPREDECKAIRNDVLRKIENVYAAGGVHTIIGVGGTNRAVCKLYNDMYRLPGTNRVMECDKVRELIKTFKKLENKELDRILKIIPDRIHTIIPGMVILNTIIKYFGAEKMIISDWGVREGYLLKQLKGR